jgi:hypothetical protein
MSNLPELVREALDRRRAEASGGCFVHNAAAAELMEYGCEAVATIESEVSTLATADHPRDLDSVMVIYARLIRELQLGDRCVAFLRRLQPPFRQSALDGLAIGWRVKDPQRACGPSTLPEPLRHYVEEVLSSGSDTERRTARRILDDHAP